MACEWALHRAATAADVAPDPASFARLTQEDPATLSLVLAPGATVVDSRYPVASLVLAHRGGTPSLQEVAQRLALGESESAVVWRCGMKPEVAPCSDPAGALLNSLLRGDDLNQALDRALGIASSATSPFDFSAWLTRAVETHLVLGVAGVQGKPANPMSLHQGSPP
ncbi:MAG: hypothetical protein R3E42_03190 [Burkholderiaceae bacterium]